MGELSSTRWSMVVAAQAGDAEALRALCEKYRPAIAGWLARRGLGADVEDVTQEALLALVSSALGKARPTAGRFRNLVFAVARHVMLRHRERAGAQKRGAGRVIPLDGIDPSVEPPDEDFDREWLGALLQAALNRLAGEHPPYFEAIRRFVLEGQPQARIAADLGITTGAVKKHVLRGKRKLSSYLRDEVWSYADSAAEYQDEVQLLVRYMGPLAGPEGS